MALVATAFTMATIVLAMRLARWPAVFRAQGSGPEDVEAALPTDTALASSSLACRILFVTRVNDELVLDCVAAAEHPARDRAVPGAPFTLEVSAFGSCWFADSMERFLRRLAEEDRVVSFELATGPEGDRLDVRSDATRMRFDLRSRVGLA